MGLGQVGIYGSYSIRLIYKVSRAARLTRSQVLGNFTSYFQKFSELLRSFDQLVPHFAEYQRLFPDSEILRRATYEFQMAIIRCCPQIILATRRSYES